jgi:hypothetical protein
MDRAVRSKRPRTRGVSEVGDDLLLSTFFFVTTNKQLLLPAGTASMITGAAHSRTGA